MLTGLSGGLLSHYFAERLIAADFAGQLGEASAPQAHTQLKRWWREQGSQLGPASSLRAVSDRAVLPLAEILGFEVQRDSVLSGGGTRVALLVGLWNDSLDSLWRNAVRAGIGVRSPWCLCTNGHELRLVDAERTYSRAYVQFDLERVVDDPQAFAVLWGMLRADAFHGSPSETPLIRQILQKSARHGAAVSRSLRCGVVDAVLRLLSGLLEAKLRRQRVPRAEELSSGFDEALTLVYRVLFLMFAEARGLVPNWHPLYRDHYTIEPLRDEVEQAGRVPRLWETLQAISRLAHRGCRAGTLIVPAFNGRLFSPARSPMAESCSVDSDIVRAALLALSTTEGRRGSGRMRIDYRDLGVEQLGAVYESVLEFVPALSEPSPPAAPRIHLRRGGDRRKATGSFYTPQSITDYLVRRTLHPLVEHASAGEILQLRIVDPSMGSAAFLVAACRYLARACERAVIRDGERHAGDINEGDRAGFRRQVAQRCVFGVDLNPAAVQLARLSLWLATLAADKPLTFLDHHLVTGDSLIGASPVDLARQPPPGAASRVTRVSRNVETPLFSDSHFEPSLAAAVLERRWLADTADDTLQIVREKEHRLERLAETGGWKALADLWCSCWMWPDPGTAQDSAVFASLADHLLRGRSALPRGMAEPLLARARDIARRHKSFHWMLEFPEVYFEQDGRPLSNPGFDAVLGNPPWDMLRADGPDGDDAREDARPELALAKRFVRGSGIYRHQGVGHVNRYQLFLERALMLAKTGGRVGLVLPSGLATDHTSSSLRRRLFDHCDIDSLAGFDNRRAIFPIHRSVRFVVFTATSGPPTDRIRCRFGIDDPAVLDAVPDNGDRVGAPVYPITLTPRLIRRISGEQLRIPDLRTTLDLAIIERVVHCFPRLADADGWHAKFGRELNASDDRRHFRGPGRGLPVLAGKDIGPFVVGPVRSRQTIPEEKAAQLLDPARSFKRRRLAYRDVASATNKLSLIAAVLPAGVVTTHSLFCLKTILEDDEQAFLCGMLNSFVANYLVRQVMTTHLGSRTIEDLRVPKPARDSAIFREIAELATRLRARPSPASVARLQALAALAYDLTADDFRHVLTTFPLIPESERSAALEQFSRC